MVIILMGVSGCGKSLIGRLLCEQLHWPFADGDDFHPPQNKQKMACGQPLNDADRLPWLKNINALLREHSSANTSCIVACSALKKTYRDMLRSGVADTKFVHLFLSRATLEKRLQNRFDHFFNPVLLDSQLATLEIPDSAENIFQVDAEQSPEKIVAEIREKFSV